MNISTHDLKTQYHILKNELDSALQEVINDTDFILGEAVASFERNFADFCGTEECIGVGSGTAALWLIYQALNFGEGDEVITTPFSFIATVEPLMHLNVRPVFADIDPKTYNLDPARVEDSITPNTKAIVAVHLYGQPSHIDSLRYLANKHDLYLIEDAAQAHGARWKKERAGALGDAAAFSFYPGKNLGAFGEAGGITTSREDLAEKLRQLRDHGRTSKYSHYAPGFNHRMDGLQGAVLDVKLDYLDDWNKKRRSNAATYNQLMSELPVRTPRQVSKAEHVFYQYVIRLDKRNRIKNILQQKNIETGVHYPRPLHLQPSLKGLNYEAGDFPEAERVAGEVLSLPVHSMLDRDDLTEVVSTLKEAISRTGETVKQPDLKRE